MEFAQGHFIVKMDYAFFALDNVSDLDTNDVANFIDISLKAIIEDVVCHALSIAQVALPADQKAITQICQVVSFFQYIYNILLLFIIVAMNKMFLFFTIFFSSINLCPICHCKKVGHLNICDVVLYTRLSKNIRPVA